jgi:hypothetical protein
MGGFVQRTKPSAGIGGGAEAGAQRDLDAVGHSMKSENRRIQEAQRPSGPAAVTPTVSPSKSTFSYANPPPPSATVKAHRASPSEDLEAQDTDKGEGKKGSLVKTLAIVLVVLLVLGAIGGGVAFLVISGKKAKTVAKK